MITLQEILGLLNQLSTEDLNTLRTVLLNTETVPTITLECFIKGHRLVVERRIL